MKSSCICKKKSSFKPYIIYKNETVFKAYEGTVIGQCESCRILKTFPSKKNKLFNPVITKAEDYEKRKKEFENLFAPLTEAVRRHTVKKGSVLDVGCSSGILLSLLKRKGFDVYGLEPNRQAYLYAKKTIKKNVFKMTLSQFLRGLSLRAKHSIAKQSINLIRLPRLYPRNDRMAFDCIIYNHVLEHIEDVNSEFLLIKKVLKKSGFLIIGVPNTHNMIFKIRRKYWEPLLPNEHVWHFNTKYLVKHLQKHKFEIIKISFEDDARKSYPVLKRIYFTLLSFLNKMMGTGEAVLIVSKKI